MRACRTASAVLERCRRGWGAGGRAGRVARGRGRSAPFSAAAASAAAAVAPGKAAGDLPKNYEHVESEPRLYQWWETSGHFAPDAEATGEPFVISMPPPNVTGALHMGHAMFSTLQDILTRFRRMQGRPTLWLPGTDHAGIATQLVVEKLLASEGTSRQELGRDKFLERVWEWKAQYGNRITTQLRSLGASCDWSRERFTLDDQLSKAVLEAFLTLHERGLVYRGTYMVNWAPTLQTAVSDLEVEFSDENGKLFFFNYPLAEGDESIPVATTRPETILGDTAVAVHPEDPRFKHLIGKEVEVPMSGGRRIPVIGDEYVDMEFGTGALKITPAHDTNDYEIGKRFDLPLISIMNKDGSMNARAGKYEGLDRFECRKQLWADMEEAGLVIKVDPYTNRVPRSQRGGEIIEPMVSAQWFVKMEGLAKPALAAVDDGSLTIVPNRFEKIYRGWLTDIKDWCISRQLWWGHRIPVWYVHESEEALELAKAADDGKGASDVYIVARSEEDARAKADAEHGEHVVIIQENDVLDTWFSSGLWPFSTLGWPDEGAADLAKFYPTAVMETGHDILFFWVARMVMMGIEFTGKVPFHTVFLHGLVRDDKGRKMSKSLGNVVDPLDVIESHGTDALRFTLATGTSPGLDLNLSMDRLKSNRNFTNKVWNVGKYVLFSLEGLSEEERLALVARRFDTAEALGSLPLAERWIVSRLHETAQKATAALDKYDFGEAGRLLYEFLWNELADWYVEASKTRTYGEDAEAGATARAVLLYTYETTLRLLHPYVPYVTEEMWQALPHEGEALIKAAWPVVEALPVDAEAIATFEALQDLVRSVRNARAEYSVEPAKKIPATLVAASDAMQATLAEETAVLAMLARLDPDSVSVAGAAPADGEGEAVQLVVREGLEVSLPLAGLADPEKELARLKKQHKKLSGELGGLKGRLSSASFVEKAPQQVVDKAKAEAAELEAQLAQVEQRMEQMDKLLATFA